METTVLPDKNGHVRIHQIKSSVPCVAYDCGFAVNRGSTEPVGYDSVVDGNAARAFNSYSSCTVQADEGQGAGEIMIADPNLNLLYPKVAVPAVKYQIRKGKQTIQTGIYVSVQ